MIVKSLRVLSRLASIFILLQGLSYTRLATRYAPQPNQYTRFGGNWRQASYCLLAATVATLTLELIGPYCQAIRKLQSERAPFVNLIRPLCLVYCTGVWLQYAFGVGLVDWPKSGRWCPRWYGHTLYTFPILAVTIESFIARHQSNGFLQAWCRSSMAIGCFVGWHVLIWACEAPRNPPNRLFDLAWWKQVSFWLVFSLVHLTMLAIGYCIDWAVYGEPLDEDDESADEHDKSD